MTQYPIYLVKTEQFTDFVSELKERIQTNAYLVHAAYNDLTAFKAVAQAEAIDQAVRAHSIPVGIGDFEAQQALGDALAARSGNPLIALFDPEEHPMGTHLRSPQAELHRSLRIDVSNAPLVKVHREYFQPVEVEINVNCTLEGDRDDRYSVWLWGPRDHRATSANSTSYGGVFVDGELQQRGAEKAPEWVLPHVVDVYHEINHMRKLHA